MLTPDSLISTSPGTYRLTVSEQFNVEMFEVDAATMYDEERREDCWLYSAAIESLQTGTLTPLLKEELKYRIQARRLSEGKAEMAVSFTPPPTLAQKLRPDEVERQTQRREQNRRAATKFRLKRRSEFKNLVEECTELEVRNTQLRHEVQTLTAERDILWQDLINVFPVSPHNCLGIAVHGE